MTFQVGDLLNFSSAVFFGVHMLRTEHISRATTKENLLPLLGYEVSLEGIELLSVPPQSVGFVFSVYMNYWDIFPFRYVWLLFYQHSGMSLEFVLVALKH